MSHLQNTALPGKHKYNLGNTISNNATYKVRGEILSGEFIHFKVSLDLYAKSFLSK